MVVSILRAFIAVGLSEETRAALAEVQSELRRVQADVKWVAVESIHITLKFLGWVDDAMLEKIKAVAASCAAGGAFSYTVNGLGSFPPGRKPRVVWAGVTDGAARLIALAQKLDAALEPLGFEKENRPFVPHLTIGRVRSPRKAELLAPAIEHHASTMFGTCEVSELILFESKLSPRGATYLPVERFNL